MNAISHLLPFLKETIPECEFVQMSQSWCRVAINSSCIGMIGISGATLIVVYKGLSNVLDINDPQIAQRVRQYLLGHPPDSALDK